MQGEPAHVAIDVTAVERIAALGWRGLEEAHLGAWLLRAADGFTGRSNSAVLLGAPPQTVADWLPDLVRWYSQRGLPPMVQVPLPGGEAIDASLAAAGWRTHDLVRFLTGDITDVRNSTARSLARASEGHPVSDLLAEGALHSDGPALVVQLDDEPDDTWLAAYHYRGAPLPTHAREVLVRAGEDTELSFASLRAPTPGGATGAVVAVARGAVGQGWLGVTAVTVADQHRRRRYGTRLMSELAAWAAERGARAIYLQVAADNGPALEMYSRMGFHHHHDYRYRIGPHLADSRP